VGSFRVILLRTGLGGCAERLVAADLIAVAVGSDDTDLSHPGGATARIGRRVTEVAGPGRTVGNIRLSERGGALFDQFGTLG
jgi:hypothetical protein